MLQFNWQVRQYVKDFKNLSIYLDLYCTYLMYGGGEGVVFPPRQVINYRYRCEARRAGRVLL